jgi:hypothetical protein
MNNYSTNLAKALAVLALIGCVRAEAQTVYYRYPYQKQYGTGYCTSSQTFDGTTAGPMGTMAKNP